MDNLHVLKPGGILILVGLCVPNSALDITAEKVIRNCWTFLGNNKIVAFIIIFDKTQLKFDLKTFLLILHQKYIFASGIYNYRAEHLKKAVQLAATSEHVFQALSIIKGCVSSPIGLAELQVLCI